MNPIDDDRNARAQVTLRLERELLNQMDEIAQSEGIDRTELARRLLADGLAHRRVESATADYAAGRSSAWAAASRAGIDLYEMLDRIAEAGIQYRIDPDALNRLGGSGGSPGSGSPGATPVRAPGSQSPRGSRPRATAPATTGSIAELVARYRPSACRILFVGESSPAGGTHFYQADSNLYRATQEAFGKGLSVARVPDGDAFLDWFRDLGCWLIDLADRPVNDLAEGDRSAAVGAGIPRLAVILRQFRPERVVVVLRQVAPAVRSAAAQAGFDEHAIDVLPFPVRQWRLVYVEQLAGIVGEVLAGRLAGGLASPGVAASPPNHAVAETTPGYGTPLLHEVMVEVLRRHGDEWVRSSVIAQEIAEADLWRRPSDGRHPPARQISAHARAREYADLFQTSDLGIRLRG
jgi:hypothetical protein